MKQLIINADDYGLTHAVSRGIREAHLHGVVTSTTCMMNILTTANDITVALKETPNLGMGVHLVLTMGRPVSAPETIPSIVDKNGNFFQYTPLIENLGSFSIDDVKREWRAQIETFIQVVSRKPDHIDSHHHSSYFTPELLRSMLEIADEYDCPVRQPIGYGDNPTMGLPNISKIMKENAPRLLKEFNSRKPDIFFVHFYDEGATKDELLNIINHISDGTSELMCHPGHVDEAFARESAYNFQRERELQILTDPSIKAALEAQAIQLITFTDL